MRDKRGQVTIFIIIAILIILIGLFIFLIYPRATTSSNSASQNPESYIQSCVIDDLQNAVETIALRGGEYQEPYFGDYYKTDKVKYICYVNEDNKPCNMQIAFIKDYFEMRLESAVKSSVDGCFESLRNSYIGEGYGVNILSDQGKIIADITDGRVNLNLKNYKVILTKQDNTQTYSDFQVNMESDMKKLIDISSKIVEDERTIPQGVELNDYRLENLDVDITGFKFTEGTNIYILKSKTTREVFQFASRSYVNYRIHV